VSGAKYHATLRLHRPYELSVVPFPTFCGACEVTCVVIGHFNRFRYLFIYLLTWLYTKRISGLSLMMHYPNNHIDSDIGMKCDDAIELSVNPRRRVGSFLLTF